ncbi:uncharacterized protein DUF4959 [Anseongella ginsenosidimutans]|uniref:Uncharacterized protein DUF4959 n=1 Tax=Anseongella ginsenosidimutans TaxID=496056 RepID=A0A4R3KN25_9SPHI|nr:DUF5000 domain-containing lipoprotein [Anseongella ginsenosidimutans]TCS85827.1 uncharacterized protein DUF4959 [Anseongella ginsenosidimutans]
MNTNKVFLGFLGMLMIVSACKKDQHKMTPLDNDGAAPAAISNVEVENLPGAARISYTLPDDEDLLYVVAECETENGIKEGKASLFGNGLLLDGFGDTRERKVTLYAVDRGENKSEPVTVNIQPLTPPMQMIRNSVEVNEDFGGVKINFKNELEAPVVINILTPDSVGEWSEVETWYTSQEEGAFSIRGFEAKKRKFAIYVRDQWENLSDTLIVEKVPLFEEELDKSNFSQYNLHSDASAGYGWVMTRMWDGSVDEPNGFHTAPGSTFPHHYTFDLGGVYQLSRYTMWQRGLISGTDFLYAHGNPRQWEIWGATDPASDGSWDGWTKLADCESIKPSGSPIGTVTNEDREYAMRGHEFLIPLEAPAVRYIRLKIINTWGGASYSHVMELSFWGAGQ